MFERFVLQIKTQYNNKPKEMLEFYPNLNINSGMIQEQSESILKTSCGRTGNKKNHSLSPHFKPHFYSPAVVE